MSKWISVEERMPLLEEAAWLCCDGRVYMGYCDGWLPENIVVWKTDGRTLFGVSHWMAIDKPEPPIGIGTLKNVSDSTRPELVVEYDTATMDG